MAQKGLNFNSIKVQLELIVLRMIFMIYLYFNSIKVQLERPFAP